METELKLQRAASFKFELEDHTIGNMVRMYVTATNVNYTCVARVLIALGGLADMHRQLLEDPDVLFSGYKMPHPLENHIIIKIQTRDTKTPQETLHSALQDLFDEIIVLEDRFKGELAKIQASRAELI